jgi:hypothetical protein
VEAERRGLMIRGPYVAPVRGFVFPAIQLVCAVLCFPRNGRVDGPPQSCASRRGTRRYTARRRLNRYNLTLPAL